LAVFTDILNGILPDLLACPELCVALRQRAKFEGWLKIELAAALLSKGLTVRLEREYPGEGTDRYRADLSVKLEDTDNEILVMLKTVNTNFRFPYVDCLTRPITKNIKGLIDDVRKLELAPRDTVRYIVFTVFPLSCVESKRNEQFCDHIAKLQCLNLDFTAMEFIPRTEHWGVGWYAARLSE